MLNLLHLDDRTRPFMYAEVDRDVAGGSLYLGEYLSVQGQTEYPVLLKEAVQRHDDDWLAEQLARNRRIVPHTQRRKPRGGYATVRVRADAHEMLAEGEFNRFYIRGLCLRAIDEQTPELIIYRAKPVMEARPHSQMLIGTPLDPQRLLDDLRTNIGVDGVLGVPGGPNSGLSVRLP